ncbi:hypothetical protein [Rhodohalobacter sp. 8-1]|uniref:hypothetical protein n=1 Tax=Rhodohalobacter sp. 8-1 TaxID=3131972 RepID=UPI0030EC0E64
MKIDYLNVDQDQVNSFTNQVIDELLQENESRVSDGTIDTWAMYSVLFYGSASTPYNYVSVTISSSLNSFDVPNNNYSDPLVTHTEQNRFEITKSELWTVRNSISDLQNNELSNYMMMDYMDVRLGRELEYQMLEDEVAKPIHEHRLDRGIMEAWEMYQLVTPGGIDYGYNFATGNYFSSLEHIEFGFNEELIRSQNPDVNVAEFFDHIWSTRDLVRSEVWLKMESVRSPEPAN